jgi:hypothetical protein
VNVSVVFTASKAAIAGDAVHAVEALHERQDEAGVDAHAAADGDHLLGVDERSTGGEQPTGQVAGGTMTRAATGKMASRRSRVTLDSAVNARAGMKTLRISRNRKSASRSSAARADRNT